MRWNERVRNPKYNVPYKTKFLFIPKCLEGKYRWLEVADIEVEWIKFDENDFMDYKEVRFLNENKILKDLYLILKEKLSNFKKKK